MADQTTGFNKLNPYAQFEEKHGICPPFYKFINSAAPGTTLLIPAVTGAFSIITSIEISVDADVLVSIDGGAGFGSAALYLKTLLGPYAKNFNKLGWYRSSRSGALSVTVTGAGNVGVSATGVYSFDTGY